MQKTIPSIPQNLKLHPYYSQCSERDSTLYEGALARILAPLKYVGLRSELHCDDNDTMLYSIKIYRDVPLCEEVFCDESVHLTDDCLQNLATKIEVLYADAALTSLNLRMSALGWQVSNVASASGEAYRYITLPNGQGHIKFRPTYNEIAAVRRELDAAEVNFLLDAYTPALLQAGWRFTEDSRGTR